MRMEGGGLFVLYMDRKYGRQGGSVYEEMKSRKSCAALCAVYKERKDLRSLILGGSFALCEGGRSIFADARLLILSLNPCLEMLIEAALRCCVRHLNSVFSFLGRTFR